MSRKYDYACFFCDYWWLFLILLVLALAAVMTKDLWGPALFPAPPTAVPTALPTSTPAPMATPTEAPPPTATPAAPTPGTGDVQVTLKWAGPNDLDIHVIDPTGEEIYYGNQSSVSQGALDIDSNAACVHDVTDTPIENIYWPFDAAPSGNYQVSVVYYRQCGTPAETPFTVRVLVDGVVKEFTGQVSSASEVKLIYEFAR